MNLKNDEMKDRITQVENESQNNLMLYQETSDKLQAQIAESEEESREMHQKINEMKLKYEEEKENYENYIAEVQESNKNMINERQTKLDSYKSNDNVFPLDKVLSIVDSGIKFPIKLLDEDE